MVVAIGYRTKNPPERVGALLNGRLVKKRSIKGIQGFTKFVIQDLEAYKDESGGYYPVITEPGITWRKSEDILIGEI